MAMNLFQIENSDTRFRVVIFFTRNRSCCKNFALFNVNITLHELFYIYQIQYNSVLEIYAIHTHDTASVYLKQSEDSEISFVPFRKPKDSWCSSQDYYFETDCANVQNVSFGNNESSFILVRSYQRLLEVSKDSETILNDRIFKVQDYFNNELNKKDTRLREVQTSDICQTGETFCANGVEIGTIKSDNSGRYIMNTLINNGGCYGLLWLPASLIFFNNNHFNYIIGVRIEWY